MDAVQTPDPIVLTVALIEAFSSYYEALINDDPVQCLETKTTFDACPKPTVIILDVGLFFPLVYYIKRYYILSKCLFSVFFAFSLETHSFRDKSKHPGASLVHDIRPVRSQIPGSKEIRRVW